MRIKRIGYNEQNTHTRARKQQQDVSDGYWTENEIVEECVKHEKRWKRAKEDEKWNRVRHCVLY